MKLSRCRHISPTYLSTRKASSLLASLLLMAINLISPQHPSRWGRCSSCRRSEIRGWMKESGPCGKQSHAGGVYVPPNTLSFVSGLLWANINGVNLVYHRGSHGGSGRPHMRRAAHLRGASTKWTKFNFPARLWWPESYESLKCIWEPCWFDLGRVATDVLCCCFASNCSLFICGVSTEEPWQRQFSVTCRETGIKTLLILILIIPTWNIWNKTAM